MTSPPPDPVARLQSALEAFLAWRASGPGESAAAFLERHAPLRDLLEPMLVEPPAAPAPEGRILGGFTLVREIGRGGMGVVYEARQRALQRTVALKLLPEPAGADPTALARFQREAAAAARLDHPGIVKVHGVGVEGGTHWFAMELIAGAPLDRVLDEARRVPPEALRGELLVAVLERLAPQADAEVPGPELRDAGWVDAIVVLIARVADALAHAHRAGLVHRDVKPSNILVRRDGAPVLTDFGLARGPDQPALTGTGGFAGTPYYVAPEQALGLRAGVDPRSDVFSLGVTLYECITLRRPFEGATSLEVLRRIQGFDPVDPRRLNREVSEDLAAVVFKAIEKTPAARYQGAAELALDLRAVLDRRPVSARPLTRARRALRWAAREPWQAALLLVLLLAVPSIGGLLGHLVSSRHLREAGRAALHEAALERELERGFLELSEPRPAAAEAAFRRALTLAPGSGEARAGLALALVDQGAVDQAVERLEPADDGDRGLLRLRAHVLRAGGRGAEADAALARAGTPGTAWELFLSGMQELSRGDAGETAAYGRGVTAFTEAVQAAPRARLLFHMLLARAAGKARDAGSGPRTAAALTRLWPDSPIAWFAAGAALSTSDSERALKAMQRSAELDPDNPRTRANIGQLLLVRGELGPAQIELRRAVAMDPTLCVGQVNLGLALHRDGKPDQALVPLRAAAALEPRNAEVARSLAAALRDAGHVDEGLALLERACVLAPNAAEAHNDLGVALRQKGDLPRAIASFERALAVEPGHAAGRANLGTALFLQGERERGVAEHRRAAELAPRDARIQFGLGAVLVQVGETEEPRQCFARALELDPDLLPAHHNLCELLAAGGELQALRAARRAWAERHPEDAAAWLELARALFDPRRPGSDADQDAAGAAAAAARAVAIGQRKDARALSLLAEAQNASGQRDAALATLAEAIATADPDLRSRLVRRQERWLMAGPGSVPASQPAAATDRRPR